MKDVHSLNCVSRLSCSKVAHPIPRPPPPPLPHHTCCWNRGRTSHWALCCRYASLLGQYNFSPELDKGSKPRSSPWLFLEPKRNTYSEAALKYLWGMIEDLGLQTRVAIWAMDQTHYNILMGATNGHAHVIWAYMDQVWPLDLEICTVTEH